ncbi:hypothetical protein RRG08_062224 [Elysia crispata]|uniref:Uncharacterized protein n=1 Tax=Elysia crispata TaxID=231223 RepID=A0AAE0YAC0_9GAST|nr:hypothetical protein RRG08_062224 [Elysia crispata]
MRECDTVHLPCIYLYLLDILACGEPISSPPGLPQIELELHLGGSELEKTKLFLSTAQFDSGRAGPNSLTVRTVLPGYDATRNGRARPAALSGALGEEFGPVVSPHIPSRSVSVNRFDEVKVHRISRISRTGDKGCIAGKDKNLVSPFLLHLVPESKHYLNVSLQSTSGVERNDSLCWETRNWNLLIVTDMQVQDMDMIAN